MKKHRQHKPRQSFLHHWLHIAAYMYLTICIFDFIMMPVVYQVVAERVSDQSAVTLSMKYQNNDQLGALKELRQKRAWDPITLAHNGVFHITFGGILGIAAYSRGREKIAGVTDLPPDPDDDKPGGDDPPPPAPDPDPPKPEEDPSKDGPDPK